MSLPFIASSVQLQKTYPMFVERHDRGRIQLQTHTGFQHLTTSQKYWSECIMARHSRSCRNGCRSGDQLHQLFGSLRGQWRRLSSAKVRFWWWLQSSLSQPHTTLGGRNTSRLGSPGSHSSSPSSRGSPVFADTLRARLSALRQRGKMAMHAHAIYTVTIQFCLVQVMGVTVQTQPRLPETCPFQNLHSAPW